MTKIQRRGRNKHALADRIAGEVLIPTDIDANDLKALPLRNDVLDELRIRVWLFDAEVDLDVVITLALEVILKIAFTLNEKIVIDSSFLKNRNVSFEFSSGDFRLDDLDFDSRPRVNIQVRRDATRRGIVVKPGEIHFGSQPALALILVLQPLNAAASTSVGDLTPPMNDGNAPFGSAEDDVIRQKLVAIYDRRSVFGARAFLDVERDEYLLALLRPLDGGRNRCLRKTRSPAGVG